MRSTVLSGFIACSLLASVFTGCSSNDDLQADGNNQEASASKVAPLHITVGKSGKTSRVIINDNDGKNGDSDNAVFAIDSLQWEADDYLWAYSPDYVDPDTQEKGGYTKLKLNSAAGGQSSDFVAVSESKYVPGKPLFIYYHGGNPGSPNGESSSSTVTDGIGDGTLATFTRPYDSDNASSSALFMIGKDANKTVKDNPYFVRSAYIASAPETGVIPNCTLQGRMPMLSFRLPWGSGLVGTLLKSLGTMSYTITVACKDDNGKWVFPDKVSLKYDENGKLSETVDSYGDPLKYTISEIGLTNPTGQSLLSGNGMVYVSIPAVSYKDLRVEVKITGLDSTQGLLSLLAPGLSVDNQVLTCPKDLNNGFTFTLNPENSQTDAVIGLGNAMLLGSHEITRSDILKHPILFTLGLLGNTLGVYEGPGANWATSDGSLIELGK